MSASKSTDPAGVAHAKAQLSDKSSAELKTPPSHNLDQAGREAATGGGLVNKGGADAWRMHEDHDFEGATAPDFIATNSEEIAKGGRTEIRDGGGERA